VAAPEETRHTGVKELFGTGRVLIVDDEEAIRALVEFTLTHLGYKVCSAQPRWRVLSFIGKNFTPV